MTEVPLVTIRCITYNHEPYIRECLDGFVMQKTNFRFEVIVHDDASTDGTTDIIREYAEKYPDIIKPIYQKENQYSKFGFGGISKILNENTRGKYVAFCEGDDYWTDPYKVQKQVDILDNHPDYGCVYTKYITVDTNSNICYSERSQIHMARSHSGDIFADLLLGNFPQTLTILYRANLINSIFNNCENKFDYSRFLSLAIQSKFYYLDEQTGAYRINPKGMIMTNGLRKGIFQDVKNYFIEMYLCGNFKKSLKQHTFTLWVISIIIFTSNNINSNIIKLIRLNPSILMFLPLQVFKRLYIKRLKV